MQALPATVHTTAGTHTTGRALSRAHIAVAEQRLRICIGILTDSDVLTRTFSATSAARIRGLHNAYIAQRKSNIQELCATPDEVVNALPSSVCRE